VVTLVRGNGIKSNDYDGGVTSIGFALQEYHDNIGDLDGPEEKERAQARTKEIIAAL
jgi:hypothetical protein